MAGYDHIFYLDCPHFTVGRVDQWGESGYLLYDGKIFAYEEDRKDQCGSTHSPMSFEDFMAFAEAEGIVIPPEFTGLMKNAKCKLKNE